MKHWSTVLVLLLLTACRAATAVDPLQAFPAAEPGMTRHVLQLPALPDEFSAKVELQVGKTVKTDADNRYHFAGTIETETISGWGYPRYLLKSLGPMAGTLMAPRPGQPQIERFITLGGEPYLIRYNSKLPIVIYVPSDAEVRYRIWQATPAATAMPKG